MNAPVATAGGKGRARGLGGHALVDEHCRRRGHDHVVVVSRSTRRAPELDLEIYGFTVRDRFPVVSIPLVAPDPEVPLDLNEVFRRAYDTGPYRKIIDYRAPLEG